MSNLKQRLERIEKAASPKDVPVAEWAIREIEADQEFQRRLNEMKAKYGAGEPTPLLTPEEVLLEAKKLTVKYGTRETSTQAFLEYERSPEGQKILTEMKEKYGLA